MSKFSPPESFKFDQPAGWPTWRRRFERYRTVDKLDRENNKHQVSTLIYSMGMEAENIYASMAFDNDDYRDKYDIVIQKF